VRLLQQAEALLEYIDREEYAASPPAIAPHRVGGHLRHVLEFYECFLDGVESGSIDYDARKRDLAVETDRAAALAKMHSIAQRLVSSAFRDNMAVRVRMEDGECFLTSSVARELQVLTSHTVHHFALISLVLRMLGIPVDPDFGMAPSTLRYLAEAPRCAR
jgi:uncharacterized damage-inducible protein DinB